MEGNLSVSSGVHRVQAPSAEQVGKLGRNLDAVATKINDMVAKGQTPSAKLEGKISGLLSKNSALLADPQVRGQLESSFKDVAASVIRLRQQPGAQLALLGVTAQLASYLPQDRGRTLDLDMIEGVAEWITTSGVVMDEGGRPITDKESAHMLGEVVHRDFLATSALQEAIGQNPTSAAQFIKSWFTAHSGIKNW